MARRAARIATLLAAGLAAAFLALDAIFPFPYAALRPPPARVVRDRAGEPLRVFLPPDGRLRYAVRAGDVSPAARRALIASEDRWFGRHPGVNPLAVLRAAWSNLRAGRVVSGASTIPMQVARLVEPRPRTLGAKCIEAFRAVQLTLHAGDEAAFEAYLNLAPYGGNLEGIAAASEAYFGKPPRELSLAEAALLTALPRSPNAYDPVRRPKAARAARDRVLLRLAAQGDFPRSEAAEALSRPLPTARRRPAFAAPHFAQMAADATPGAPEVRTTLDRETQRIAEATVRARARGLREIGIDNAAAVVLDLRGRAVRAMAGSAGFFERAYDGEVNLATARRSPGSTLKPFLYAMAIDRGAIAPETRLLDVPTSYGGYVAENYDDRYRGLVTAREALVHSLNAPAVRLLAGVGLRDFHRLLLRGGLATLDRPTAEYGLPLILGAGETTLLDLTNLYATLAEGGLHRPVRFLEEAPGAPERLFSAEAARLVSEILQDVRRPDMPEAWRLARDAPAAAWKTGTSYGHRDAWAVGFSGEHAIGVWVGNPDGRGRKGISGSEHAAPILFDLFRALEPGGAPPRIDAPRLGTRSLCALSRALATPDCPSRVEARVVEGATRLKPCDWHRRVLVDAATGAPLAPKCVGKRPARAEVETVLPAELVAWRIAEGEPPAERTAPLSECEGAAAAEGPRIVSPEAATPYRIRRGAPLGDQGIRLAAQAPAGAARLFWYQDGVLVASGAPGAALFVAPERGAHRIAVVDEAGRSDAVRYTVE